MSLRLLCYGDVETAYDDPGRIGRLAGLVGALRGGETVVCGVGDDLGPGVLPLVTRGRQALHFFRAVDADVDTLGNHDFDHGTDPLLAVIEDAPTTWVCANAVRDGDRLGAAVGVVPWTVVETDDHRVGVVGVAHPETADLNPNAAGIRFTDPRAAVESGVKALREEAVDRTVVLAHLGDLEGIARGTDADAVLGGHDHEPLVDRVDGTLVCRPGGTGRYLLAVSFGGDGPTATHHPVEAGPLDEGVAATFRDRMESAGLDEVVGTVEDPVVCDLAACKRGESRIGNLITDAYRWRSGADVALNPGGGFRRRPPLAGAVTVRDLVSVTPYAADLVTARVDGATLRATLGHLALAGAPDDLPDWQFGHVSGARLVYDDAAGELRSASVGGDPVDPEATYRLATTDFFVANDDLFPAFGPDDVVERHGPQYGAVVEYAREVGLAPELEGRIRRPTLDEDAVPERDWPHSP